MNKLFLTIILMVCAFTLHAAGAPGGGSCCDSIHAVSLAGDQFIFSSSQNRVLGVAGQPEKAPHIVGSVTEDKLSYSIFDFEMGGGYVATLIGWVDNNDYYSALKVPDTVTYNGKAVPVTTVNDRAFISGWGITSLTLGKNVMYIGKYAFYGCKLKKLYVPISVVRIMELAFAYNNIETVSFQNASQKTPELQINNGAFSGLFIQNFEIPARLSPKSYIMTDRSNFLSYNLSLKTITLNTATGVWSAPARAEADVTNCRFEIIDNALCVSAGEGNERRVAVVAYPAANPATTFSLTDNIVEVNSVAFRETSLQSVALKATAPASLAGNKISLLANAFDYNPSLTSLTLDAQGDIDLASAAVVGSGSLESIGLGEGVSNYSQIDDVLYQTIAGDLTLVMYPSGKKDATFVAAKGVKRIARDAMSANEFVSEVILPEGLLSIDEYAFFNCLGLRKVTLPSTVETIGEAAFCYTRLDEIDIPASVKVIDRDAFFVDVEYTDNSGRYISRVSFGGTTPPLSSNGEVANKIFNNKTLSDGRLEIPEGVAPSVFTAHPAWDFANVVASGVEAVETDDVCGYSILGKTVISTGMNPVQLLRLDGVKVADGMTVTAPAAGLYLLRCGEKTYKIIIK